ncbi:MAG: response regulator [Chloroflexi bacterium]|nr:response regulator [Chloroflexota bacterium]
MDNKTILLVEDNPGDVALTRRALSKSGVANELVVAEDGVQALKYLLGDGQAPPSPLPVVVLLDLKLPKIDGLEVLKQVRSNEATRLLPVVILTSSAEERDLVNSYNLGANSYIRKPVNFDEFAKAIRELGSYLLVLNQPPPRTRTP